MGRLANQDSWFRKLKRKHKDHWEQVFASIDNEALRIKVACLVFWDCYWQGDNDDWSIHKKLMSQYTPSVELNHTQDELASALHWLGYPIELAKERVKCPKCCTFDCCNKEREKDERRR